MDFSKEYKKKLTTAAKAAACIKSDMWVDYGWTTGTPVAVDRELAKRLPKLQNVNFRGGILLWEPEIFKIEDPAAHMTWNSWHMTGFARRRINEGFVFYAPLRYSEVPRYYRDSLHSDVAVFQTAPMDAHGCFNFGPNTSHMAAMCETADKIIVEVNKNMPRCLGGFEESIHISEVDMIVEGDNPEMGVMPASPATEIDRRVAELIVAEIPNGACLQLGIGGMPNAVGSLIAQSDLKELGVHTEMYVDAYLEMAKAGKITGTHKALDRGRQVYTFAAGSRELYVYLDGNPACMAAPVDYVNDVRTIAQLGNFVSINNAVNLDLFGQINAESAGTKHISGAGGQLDFVLGAYLSKGGKSFICCSSTFATKDGTLKSRILPTLDNGSIVTDTRTNTNYVVTEYGMVNLKGKSTWQRAEALISIAHPDFREELIAQAQKLNIWKRSSKR